MKIGIITIHFVENYGSQLQAYALQKYLQQQNYNVEIIDFRPSVFEEEYKICNIKKPKIFLLDLFRMKGRKKQKQLFQKFMNERLCCSESRYGDELSIENFKEEYDVLISGSDQLWNLELTNFSWQYFLNFSNNKHKVAYASSFGKNFKKEDQEKIKMLLEKYQSIAVREEFASELIQQEMSLDAITVADPVFLLSKYDWEKVVDYKDAKIKPNDYILVYDLNARGNKNLMRKAKIEADRLNKKIVSINPLATKRKGADYNLDNVGPEEFLWLIKNALLVCTNSFHGTAFSLIFQKDFCLGFPIHNSNRIVNLLESIEMGIVDKEENQFLPGKNIYSIKERQCEKLQEKIQKSKDYLLRAVENK